MPVARDTQGKDQRGWRVIDGGAANNEKLNALMPASIFCFVLHDYGIRTFQLVSDLRGWVFNWSWIFTLFLFLLSVDVCRGAGAVETAMSRKTDCQLA